MTKITPIPSNLIENLDRMTKMTLANCLKFFKDQNNT